MECALLWAGVCFSAQNGDPEGLLTAAAAEGLHLSQVLPCPGGFSAQCAAWRYRRLAGLARKHRVRLRTERRRGTFFVLRPFFRRCGLWAGLLLFLPLLFWLQGAVWAVDGSGLTAGQQARAAVMLWENDLFPGSFVTEEKLRADVVIMDPARAGADRRFLSNLVKIAPKRIVYVSCNPETQSRDVFFLIKNGYKIKKLSPVDMFPFTSHVETVCLLVKGEK